MVTKPSNQVFRFFLTTCSGGPAGTMGAEAFCGCGVILLIGLSGRVTSGTGFVGDGGFWSGAIVLMLLIVHLKVKQAPWLTASTFINT